MHAFDDPHEDVVLRDRSEHRRRIRRHRRAPRLAAIDRRDERELFRARVERDVDGEERSRREADHAHGVGHDAEALRVLTDELDRASAVVGTRFTCREVLGSRDDVADRSGLLGLWPWHRETGVDRRHRRFERRLVRRRSLHPVLEQERRVAEPREPTRDVEAFV